MNTLPNPPAEEVPTGMPEASAPPADRRADDLSEAQAAKRAGVARSTIQYARKNGRLPGARRGDSGWLIPLSDLIAAGFIPAEEVPTGMPEASAPPADRRADDMERLRQELSDAIAEKRDAQERAAVAEARAEAARERGDEHLRRAEQAEARLDQMLTNQTAMALTMKEQQHLIGRVAEELASDEPTDHPATTTTQSSTANPPTVEPQQHEVPEPAANTLGGRMRRWFGG